MVAINATDAKNRFGQMLEMARIEPVRIQKNGRDVGVLVSPEQFQRLTSESSAPRVNPAVVRAHEEAVKRWNRVFEALAR
jgi:prevent-host-death family protein